MTIKFLGHACFWFQDSAGRRVIVDPYEPGAFGGAIGFGPITDPADVVLVTHDHADHNYVRGVPGSPKVCRDTCQVQGIPFRAIQAWHDEEKGQKRGSVAIFVFEMDGITLCHVGDLGTLLTDEQIAALGRVDVLMVPVGGTFTLDAQQAWELVQQIKPRVVIPMHFRTPKVSLPLAPLDPFLNGKPGVERPGSSEIVLTPETLGEGLRIIALQPAN